MVSEAEVAGIRTFVCGQLRDEPDLSTLTLGILKKRYLAHVQSQSLSPEAKNIMKQVVTEELMKMQDKDESGSDLETTKPQKKRKREEINDEVVNGREDEDESKAKKSRRQSSSSSGTEDKDDCKTGSEESEEEEQNKSESEDAEQEVKKSQPKTNRKSKPQISSEDSADEEINQSEVKEKESNCEDSPEEKLIRKANATKNGKAKSSKTSQGKKTPQSDGENDTDSDSKSEKSDRINNSDSSDDSGKEEKVSVEKKNNDSDSSSLSSLEDEQESKKEKPQHDEKKKTMKKEKTTRDQNDNNKAVVRLKRYISLCGLRPNYKKLLNGCHSVHSQVAALKKKLEDLGVNGQPSVKKCKQVRMMREQAEELAELDVSNIISTQGRPKRRGASAWHKEPDPPSSTYLRRLNSGSDSDEENDTHRGRGKTPDWANLQGIISDDADSD